MVPKFSRRIFLWMKLEVIEVTHYTDKLFRIKLERPRSYRFTAGEFTMIGFPDEKIKRAYSFTSGPGDDYLEFYSIKVPNGPLTSKLKYIEPGKFLEVGDKPTGTLTLANIELGGHLWLLATGTGIAPYISLLRDPSTYDLFDKITVTWTVPYAQDLRAYNDFLEDVDIDYFPTVTREPFKNQGRITKYIEEGMWDNIAPHTDRVMICGSIAFNNDIKARLVDLGFTEGTRRTSGTFAQEKAFVS